MFRFTASVAVALVLCVPGFGRAQSFTIVGEAYRDVSAVLTDLGAKSGVFLPISPTGKQLFYIPFFAMKADKNNKLEVAVLNGPNPKTKIVAVWLLLSPQNKLDAIAAYIRAEEKSTPVDGRFKDVLPGQLIGIPFTRLDIAEETKIGFSPVKLEHYAAQGEIRLDAEVPAADAAQLAADLQNQKAQPVFRVQYELFASKTLSQSELQADIVYLSETKPALTLLGAPRSAEKFGVRVEPGGFQLDQPFLTRDQRRIFEGKMKTEVRVKARVENSDDLAWFDSQMEKYFSKIFLQNINPLDTDKTPLGRELANMLAYEFDPNDLKPDQIDNLVLDVKKFFNQEEADKKTITLGGSAAYRALFVGFSGSGNAMYTGESLRRHMEYNGWGFKFNGKFNVPKSFEVHVVNRTALQTEGALSLSLHRAERGFARFNHLVSTSQLFYPKSMKGELLPLAEVRGELAKLQKEKEELERKIQEGRPVTVYAPPEELEAELRGTPFKLDHHDAGGVALAVSRWVGKHRPGYVGYWSGEIGPDRKWSIVIIKQK